MSSIVSSANPRAGAQRGWRYQVFLLLCACACAAVPQLAAQPANDNFTNATAIAGFSGSIGGTTFGATVEPGEPFNLYGRHDHTVWYKWTAPASVLITFDNFGSSFDSILSAFTGTNLSTLNRIASDDDCFAIGFGCYPYSAVTFAATAGTTYYLAVDGYLGASGPLVLNWGTGTNSSVGPTEIAFSSATYTVNENTPGFVTVTVVSGGGFTSPATVDYYTTDGTAIAGTDYLSQSNTLTFNPGDTVQTFTIPISDNSVQNSNKTVFLVLTNPTGEATLGTVINAAVTIIDDETPPFVSPAGEFNIVWPLDGDGFQSIPLQDSFPVHTIPTTISLPFFGTNFFLFSDYPQYIVTEDETTPAPVNNANANLPSVNNYPARSVRGALITVSRSAPAVGRVLVDFYTTNLFVPVFTGTNTSLTNLFGTNNPIAQPNFDYYPVSGTLLFDDYQMSANFVVPIEQFGPGRNSRYFNVVLANPRPAPEEDPNQIIPTIGPQNFATVEIIKINRPDMGASLERVTYRQDEYRAIPQGTTNVVFPGTNFLDIDVVCPSCGDGDSATISVASRRYIFPLQVGSDYTDPNTFFFDNTPYTDGTTDYTNQADYVSTSTFTVNFAANQRRSALRLGIIGDNIVEFNEDILVSISGVSGTTFGSNRFANVTILYDDQPAGAADREWNPEGVVYTNPRFYNTPGANNVVSVVVVQPDNKTLLGGEFDHANSFSRNHVARYNIDGSIDASFNPGTGADGPVNALVLYPAGAGTNANKILIGGLFTSYNGISRDGIARLNSNGSLDFSFAPGNGVNGAVHALVLQGDGKAIVAGDFTTFNGVNVSGLIRVNTDGSLDNTFNAGLAANDSIWALAIDESGSNRVIYAAGSFTVFNGQPRSRLVRLFDDGTVDGTFDPGLGADGPIYALAVQNDEKLLIGGAFNMYHTFRHSAIARINTDGTLDETYNIGSGFDDSVYAIKLQPDGKALVGGIFTSFNTTRRMGLARLFTGGSLDTSFMDTAYNQFAGLPKTFSFDNPSFVNSIDLQLDGNIMIGGSFTNVGGNLSVNYPSDTNTFETATSEFGLLINYYQGISGRTNGHNSGGHQFAPFTRQDKTTRFNVARIIGGYTLGPGNLEYDPGSEPFVIDENAGNLAVTLRRVDGRLGTAQVVPSTTNNTATFPTDFSSSTSTETWRQYEATLDAVFLRNDFGPVSVGFVGNEYFNVPITDDMLQEGDEAFGLILSNAFGGINLGGEFIPLGAALGHNDASAATIADNDFNHGVFNFGSATYLVNENAGTATISVIRTNGASGAADIRYFTRNGTALNESDYTSVSGTLHFNNGQTSNSFTVPILNGPEVEFDETVILVLTNASGATLPGGTGVTSGTLSVSATLSIIDDDFAQGRLQFSVDNFTNNENDVSAVITVTRTGGSLDVLSVQFQTLSGGTATPGVDYTPTNGLLVWASGDIVPKTFTIPLVTDGVVEGPESVLLRLSNPSIAGALGARTNATLWIMDGDSYGTLSLNQPAYQSDENGAAPTITVVRSGGSAGTVSVYFATSPLIATPNTDYYDTNGVITFLPGEFSKTFQVQVIDNAIPDGDKTVQLSLFAPVNATLGNVSNAVLTIVDDESINTPAGSLDTTFSTLSGANAAVYALAEQLDGRIIMAGDFTQVSSVPRNRIARLKPDGILDPTFDIGPGADGPIRALALTSEGKLLVGGLFTSINSTNRSRIARLSTDGKVDISFNPGSGADNPVFAIAVQPNDKVLVGGSFNTFNNITRPGLVRLNTNGVVDSTFNPGAGFNGTIYALAVQNDGKILAGGAFISFNGIARTNFVRLNADGSLDNTFNPALAIDAPVRAVLIEPDGSIVVGGSFTNVNGITRNFLARLDKNGQLDPNFLPTGILSGADNTVYAIKQQVDGKLLVAGDFKFFNGVTRRGITRLFDADGGTDPTINFGNGANGFVGALLIQPDRRIVLGGGFTEYDDQPRQYICRIYGGSIAGSGSLEFTAPQFLVSESSSNALITVRRRGGTTGQASADAYTLDGTAHANIDYLGTSNTLVFPQGETRQQISIPILSNNTLDGDRTVNLLLGNFTNAVPGPQPVSTLVIQDDETAIGFASANFAINENAISGNASITLVRAGATNTAATVDIATTTNGTATPFVDFIPTNATVSFAPGEASKIFYVTIINDTNLEGNESVLLTLSNPSGTTSLGISNATLNIIDDDTANGQFLFSTNNFVGDEGIGFIPITVLRTNGSLGIVSVRLTTSNLTATAFADYVPTNVVLNFSDGETAKTILLPIINDTLPEPDETVLLTLTQPTGGAKILQTNATATIADDEIVPSYVGFLTNNFFVNESNGFATISVVRTNSRRGFLTVDFTVTPGTATAGVDYFSTNGTLVFNDGEDTKTFTIQIVNDTIGEGDETVRLALSNLQGSNTSLTLPTSTLTIVDDDSTLRFSDINYVTNENAGAAIITVLRVGVTNNPVSVTYSTTTGGTALAGIDYVPVTGTLNWPAGDGAPKTFLVPIIDNNVLNAAKTVSLILSNAQGIAAYVTAPTNATLTILDDETAPPTAGIVDPLFNNNFGANATVHNVTYDAQERLYIGGDFTQLYGLAINRIARLATNGAVDLTFDPGPGADATVYSIARATNGIYAAGAFTNLNGVNHRGITRLHLDGTVDNNFNPGTGVNGTIFAAATVGAGTAGANDQVYVGGQFTSINGVPANRLARLNANGTFDNTFTLNNGGVNGDVRALAVQPNGQVIIGGDFTIVNGFLLTRLARLNPDGVVDTSFDTSLGADGTIHAIALDQDGKIIIAGNFQTVNGSPRNGLARLNPDGSVDFTFDPGEGANGPVRAVAVELDNHLIVAGDFTTYDGKPAARLTRVAPDGSFDPLFDIGSGADAPVRSISLITRCVPPPVAVMNFNALPSDFTAYTNYTENCLTIRGLTGGHFHAAPDGTGTGTAAEIFGIDGTPQEITLGGFSFALKSIYFTNLSGPVTITSSSGGSVQVQANGVFTFDSTFANAVWVQITLAISSVATIDDITLIPGADALTPQTFAIGGDFQQINHVQRGRVAVLTGGGLPSPTFDPRTISTRSVYALDINTNTASSSSNPSAGADLVGKIMAGGDFTAIVGVNGQNRLARLNIDGTLDRTFRSGLGFNNTVRAVAVQADGKTIAGGLFTSYDLISRSYLARLNVDGSVDNTFNFANNGANINNPVNALVLQPDGKILIGGAFTTVYGAARNGIARMNTNGTVDVTFNPGTGANGAVNAVAVQADGKVLIGGDFMTVNGVSKPHVARLNANGSVDGTFTVGTGANGTVNAIVVQADGSIVIGGLFTGVNGSSLSRLARLMSNGAVDPSFNPGTGANDYVSSLRLQPDGRLLVGGNFTTFNGQVRNRIARLNSDGSLDPSINFGAGANDLIAAIALQNYDGKIVVGGSFTEFDGITRVAIARLLAGTNSGSGSFHFSAPAFVTNERSNAVITVVRGGGTQGSATVNYSTANGSGPRGATSPTDYTAVSGTLVFNDAESVKQFTVPVIDNSSVTGDRTFNVSLSNPSAGASISEPSNAVVTIEDNDSVIGFSSVAYVATEAAALARITVERTGGAIDPATVDFATGDTGTATPGLDFTAVRGTLVFGPGVRVRTFDVPIIDDTMAEFDETVPLFLSRPTAPSGGAPATLGISNATLTIVENDFSPGTITFGTANYFTSEDSGGITIELLRTNGHSGSVSVNFQTLGSGTAQPNIDFVATNALVTFIDGQTNAFITVYPIDDALAEGPETVPLQLSAPSGGAGLGLASATLTIVDNDAPGQFVFSSATYTVSESNVFATITVLRTNGNKGAVGVTVQNSGGTATPDVDYGAVNTVLSFADGQTVRTFTVPIFEDSIVEGTESVFFLLSNPQPPGGSPTGPSIGTPNPATLFIVDDEVSVGFATASVSALESPTNVPITLVRSGDTNAGFSVFFSTSDGPLPGGAQAGADYVGNASTVTFAPGQSTQTVFVTVLDDALAEGDETVNLTLSSASGGVALGPIGSAVLTILDNDVGFNFSSANYATNESGGFIAITVVRSGFTNAAVSVAYATADGSATAGLDYGAASNVLNFAAGQTSQVFNVTILDDLLVEGNETVLLTLSNPQVTTNTLPGNGAIFLGPQATAVLTILDNDTTVGFSPTSYVVNEKAGVAAITLVRNGAAAQAVSVGFRTQNGSATAGADYTFTTQNVVWAANDVAPKTVLVPILDDAIAEGAESVNLILSNPVGAILDANASTAVLTIVDNAGVIAFASASYSVIEGSGSALMNLVRTGGSNGVVSVQWNVTGGTATPGADYAGTQGTVVFANGESVKPIILPVLDDGLQEGIETVNLALSNAGGGARIGSPATAVLSILDDDAGIIVGAGSALIAESFSPTNSIIEPGETVTLELALRNVGVVDAANVSAGLVYANGVTNGSGPQTQGYGTLLAGGDSVSRPFTFTALGTNGTRITATLLITNNGLFLGPVSFDFVLGVQTVPFQNATAIVIPDVGPATNNGNYPATLTVSGVSGPLTKLTVTLNGLTHTYPDDLDILLVSPNGTAVMLMSDAGGGNSLNNVTVTFDDAAALPVPDSLRLTNGMSYQVANYAPLTDTIPPFAPGSGFWTNNTSLAAFNGVSPNGVWSLYVVDDSSSDHGTIAGGWSMNISATDTVIPGADLSVSIDDTPDPVMTNGVVNYTITVVNHGPAAATGVVLTNVLPAGATFINVVSGPGNYTINGNVLIGNLGNIAMNASAVVTVAMRAPGVSTQLTFDSTVAAGTADLNPNNNHASIKTSVTEGTAAPTLFAARKNGQLVLSWQGTSTNVVLQSASGLSAGSWSDATNTTVISNGATTVTAPMNGGLKFYRLKRVP